MAIRKGIVINLTNHRIEKVCTYDDTRIEGMFVKVDGKDLIPAAYVYPAENADTVDALLKKLAEAKLEYDSFVAEVYYKMLPTLR